MDGYPYHLHTLEESIEMLSQLEGSEAARLAAWLVELKARREAGRNAMLALGPTEYKYG